MKNPKLLLEVVWWLITFALAALVLYPIYQHGKAYPFFLVNAIFVVAFITLSRYIFQLEYSFWGRWQRLKLALIFLSIPSIFYLVNNVNAFMSYADDYTLDPIIGHLPLDLRNKMDSYIRTEMIFFGVASVITAVILPFRLVLSIWRQRNRNTV